jgi:hypothetical protein
MLASNERQEGHKAIVEALRNMTEAHASEVNAVLTTSQVTTSQLNTAMAERLLELIERQEEARSRQREESAASQASLLGQFIRALEQAQHQARQQQLEASQQQLQLLRASSEQQQQFYLQLQAQSEQQLKAIEASSQQTVLLIRSGTDAHQQQLQLLGQAQVQLMTQLGQAMISASPSPTQQLFLQNNFSTTTSINDNRQVLQQQLHQHLPIAGSATTASASHRPLADSDQPRIEGDSQLSTKRFERSADETTATSPIRHPPTTTKRHHDRARGYSIAAFSDDRVNDPSRTGVGAMLIRRSTIYFVTCHLCTFGCA